MASINYCRGGAYPTNVKPSHEYGLMFYDLNRQRPFFLYIDGKWKDANGRTMGAIKGTTTQRPTLVADDAGYQYFDTTLGKPIWWKGTAWVDATGADV